MAQQVSIDHLEHVSGIAWKEHEDWLKEKKEDYFKCFLDRHRQHVEDEREAAEKKAKKIEELLAAEAAAEAAEQS